MGCGDVASEAVTAAELKAASSGNPMILEQITLDRDLLNLLHRLAPEVAQSVYYGFWYTPKMDALLALIREAQQRVTGEVSLNLYKGNIMVVGRKSDDSLFDANIATFEDDAGAYDQADAAGFIKLNALRMRIAAGKGRKLI